MRHADRKIEEYICGKLVKRLVTLCVSERRPKQKRKSIGVVSVRDLEMQLRSANTRKMCLLEPQWRNCIDHGSKECFISIVYITKHT
jgi:hypothetical protein